MNTRCETMLRTVSRVAGLSLLSSALGLSQELLWTWDGKTAGDNFGSAVGGAGDVNGDGVPDLFVGARENDKIGIDAGMARVFSGRDGSILYTFYGQLASAFFGTAVSGFGDYDRDGSDDLLVSAWHADVSFDFKGRVWLYSGASGSVLQSWKGRGDNLLGASLSEVGDADGDGRHDFAFGAPWGGRDGFVAVYSGADASLIRRIDGPTVAYAFGWHLSEVGDLDGDGLADILVGDASDHVWGYSVSRGDELVFVRAQNSDGIGLEDPLCGPGDVDLDGTPDLVVQTDYWNGNDNLGIVWVYSGANGSLIRRHDGRGPRMFNGAVGAASDLNADGHGDYLVGSRGWDEHTVLLFSGRTGRVLYEYQEVYGSDHVGASFDLSGDVDGDGLPDFVAGAPRRGAAGTDAGGAYVFSTNDFFLFPSPREPIAGDTLVLDNGEETPGQPAALFLVEFNGRSFVSLIAVAPLDADGRLTLSGLVPSGLRNLRLTFQSFVVDTAGKIRDSGREVVSFL